MSSTSTSTSTYTRTQTAVYLTEVVMGTIADILADLRIDLTTLYRDWKQDEAAIAAWIGEGSLEQVVLECHQPGGTVSPVLEFPVSYRSSGAADPKFTADRAALARYRAKLDRVPAGTVFRLLCAFSKTPSPQPGWERGTRASTSGLRPLRFGTLASAPHATVGLRYLRQ
jgi:hypothetical protein